MNRTLERGLLQQRALRMISRKRDSHFGREATDPTRCISHFLPHLDRHAFQFNALPLSYDRHRCRNASSKRRSNEIGRGKRFALAHVVERSIRFEPGMRRAMGRAAMQFAGVIDRNLDHALA